MMNKLSHSDVASLRKVSKITPDYEFYSELFLTIINQPPYKRTLPDGTTQISYWQATLKLLLNINFMKNVKAFEFEFMNPDIFYTISYLIETNPKYADLQQAAQCNPALGNLISWVMGIYQYIRSSRQYCLGYADLKMLKLKEEELENASRIDKMFMYVKQLEKHVNKACHYV